MDIRPVEIAEEIHHHAVSFLHWLKLPAAERWDTFELQSLSAVLFSRYRLKGSRGDSSPRITVELSALHWQTVGAPIRESILRLQALLAAPFSVFKAVRLPVCPADCPTPEEVRLAEAALERSAGEIARTVAELELALSRYHSTFRLAERTLRARAADPEVAVAPQKPQMTVKVGVSPATTLPEVAAG
jgi:hypothetical protein